MWRVCLGGVRMGRQALRHQVGGVLLANWAEGGGGGGAVSSAALEPFQGLVCLHSTSYVASPPVVGETPDPRVLQRIFTGCLHLWLCCDLIGGGTSF